MLKFRTMHVDTDDSLHREYIRSTMSSQALPTGNGLYKPERPMPSPRSDDGCKTSLDELLTLERVGRHHVLVGPRLCIHETDNFAPHQFDRSSFRRG